MSRRRFLGHATGALLALPLGNIRASQTTPPATSDFQFDPSWPSLSADRYPEPCQISGVAVAPEGEVLVLNRGENSWNPDKGFAGFQKKRIQKPAVLVLDPHSGSLLRTWGSDRFVMPHQIFVEPAGRVWIADCGQDKLFCFDLSGNLLRELGGTRFGFQMPTDMASLSDGRLVVSDGYVNARLLWVEPDGKISRSLGTRGSRPLQFKTPHSVTVDSEDRIYVADRENHRIQVLSAEGKFLGMWENVERPLAVRFQGESVYVLSNLEAHRGVVRQLNRKGELETVCPTQPQGAEGDFSWPHGLAVSADGASLYVGYTLRARRVQRFARTRKTAPEGKASEPVSNGL
jgi:DNA-binding beta-propeller fold protein YncE